MQTHTAVEVATTMNAKVYDISVTETATILTLQTPHTCRAEFTSKLSRLLSSRDDCKIDYHAGKVCVTFRDTQNTYIDLYGDVQTTHNTKHGWRDVLISSKERHAYATLQMLWQANYWVIYDSLSFEDFVALGSELHVRADEIVCAHIDCTSYARTVHKYVPLCSEHVISVNKEEHSGKL